jgi:small subunit ribosomal protein S14
MKYLIKKDFKRRYLFRKLEKNRIIFLFFAKNKIFLSSNFSKSFFNPRKTFSEPKKKKNFFGGGLSHRFPKISYISEIRNTCFRTGRTHSVYSEFRLSRMCLKEAFNQGIFPGIKKSSWLKILFLTLRKILFRFLLLFLNMV